MYKKLSMMLAIILASIFIMVPAADARVVKVSRDSTRDSIAFESFSHGDTDVRVTQWYWSGIKENGARVTKAYKAKYVYNHEGTLGCGSGSMDYTSFNSYYWGQDGRNFNPGPVRLYCQHDGWNERIVRYEPSEVPWVSHHDGAQKWKTNVEIEWDNAWNQEGTAKGVFWWTNTFGLREVAPAP